MPTPISLVLCVSSYYYYMCVLILLHIRQQGVASDAVANSSSSPQRNHEQSQEVGRQKKKSTWRRCTLRGGPQSSRSGCEAACCTCFTCFASTTLPFVLALLVQKYLLCVTLCAVRNFFISQSPSWCHRRYRPQAPFLRLSLATGKDENCGLWNLYWNSERTRKRQDSRSSVLWFLKLGRRGQAQFLMV